MSPPEVRRAPARAAAWGAPIGFLGGLMGLGGAEFRLPVLAHVFGYRARAAVALNLAISLVTVVSALAVRSGTLALGPLEDLAPVVLAIMAGAVGSAWFGASIVHRVPEHTLERAIMILLVAIGVALVVEGFLPTDVGGLVPDALPAELAAGVVLGVAIGLVSSALGVAGGELIIPTLVFGFGADIVTAGTASLAISLPMVSVGVLRHARFGAYSERADVTGTVVPMGAGSVVGAVAGGLLAGVVPAGVLKVLLGVVLIVSAIRIFRRRSPSAAGSPQPSS